MWWLWCCDKNPSLVNSNSIYTKFQHFYQIIFSNNIKNILQEEINNIKTEMRSPYKKYSKISVPYEYRIIMRHSSNNRSIFSLQQDKWRGVAKINGENTWINVLIFWTQNNLLKYRTVQPVILKRKFNVIGEKSSERYPKTFIQRFTHQDHHQPNFMAHPRFTS